MTSTRVILGYAWRTGDKLKQSTNHYSDSEDLGLSDDLLKIAKKELREDKQTRDQCIKQLRNLLQQNEDIVNVRLDDRFLLRFLRVKKFSIPMAEQTILKYLNLRRTFTHMSLNLDYMAPAANDLITAGYMFVSPIRDRLGRRVIIVMAKNLNPKIFTSHDQARAHVMTYETLLEDPENQVLGFVHIADLAGTTTGHITNWNPTEFARIMKWGEQSLPLRHKGIHLMNVPTSVKWIIDFVKGRVSPKIKDRIHAYTNCKELRKIVDMECLPMEMGGTIPMKEMIESWKRELSCKRDVLLALDNMKLLNDRGIITSRDKSNSNNRNNGEINNSGIQSVMGSFRKLEFD